MNIRLNPDEGLVKAMRSALQKNDGYCPCAVAKTDDTKCMCKDFRDQISKGVPGKCHCGLYEGVIENDQT